MYILSLEISTRTGTVAALDCGRLIEQIPLDPRQRTAQSLTPGMVRCLAAAGWHPRDLDLVAVTNPDGAINEDAIPIEPQEMLRVFDKAHPRPKHALSGASAILDSLKKMQRINAKNLKTKTDGA